MNIRTLRKNPGVTTIFVLSAICLMISASPVLAQKVNCANEFRSGKLYFDQKIYEKAVGKFATAVEACPDKWEYHARYALALSEMGKFYIEKLPFSTTGERDTLLSKGLEYYGRAGEEFDAALLTEEGQKKKKPKKFVEANRGHYWVDAYNLGIDLVEEEDFEAAEKHFDIARMLNKTDVRSYSQGAIARMKSGKRAEALELVQTGLELDVENENLLVLETSIFKEWARELAGEGDAEKDPEKIEKALGLYDELVSRDQVAVGQGNPADPNLYFERGLTALLGSAAFVEAGDEEAAAGLCRRAALDFRASADLVPSDGENAEFHSDCIFNVARAHDQAGDPEMAMAAIKEYACLRPLDPSCWQFMARLLVHGEDQGAVVSALMMSKSLAGEEVDVEATVTSATGDAKADLEALGAPDHVFTYQEASGSQIHTWIWLSHDKAVSYVLGEKNGEVAPCGGKSE